MMDLMITKGSARLLAILLAGASLSGCSGAGPEVFDRAPRSATADSAPWPQLAAIPATPPPGVYTGSVPDPAKGETIQIELAIASETAARRREALAGPVR